MKIKTILVLSIILCINKSLFADKIEEFRYELKSIANSFIMNIMDQYKCEDSRSDAEDLADEIKEYKEDQSENLSYEEKQSLSLIQNQSESLEEYITMCCSSSSSHQITLKEFNLANELVHADMAYLNKEKYCIDFIEIRINNFVCLAYINDKASAYNIKFNWKAQNAGLSGKIDSGISKQSIGTYFNNRNNELKGNVTFVNVECKIINYSFD
jgi:hypothetical protein